MKTILSKKFSIYQTIAIALTIICWLFAFFHQVNSHYSLGSREAIPAFETNTTISYPTARILSSSFLSHSLSSENSIYAYLRQYDSAIEMISCHHEKNYTDLYFYSPKIQKKTPQKKQRNFNLQVAITHNKVYFGSPFIKDTF